MSDPTPSAGAATAVKPSGATEVKPVVPAATPKKSRFKVSAKHDWCVTDATSEGDAEQKFRKFFGIRGTDHELQVERTSDEVGHSGQKTVDTTILGGGPPKE